MSPKPPNQQQSCVNDKEHHEKLSQADIRIIMDRLGVFYDDDLDGDGLQERFGADELVKLFEEEEPSLKEVKEAFDVFDENKDGFIDARDLQRVLCQLGLKERSEVEECRRMIQAVAKDGNGKIDFIEFVRFMESFL